jgi:acetyl-CoA carboxylase biotin carboxylase subunit
VFRRLLVANRGEIALRVLRAARSLGMETVAVHSEADREAPWLEHADRSVCIGPARSGDSYLDARKVLQAAEQTECQAIHPGYGFLSENGAFAAACEQQGITFVGPGPGVIRRMGDKAAAKRGAAEAGLPTIPGSVGLVESADRAAEVAREIGYPVLLKARSGGGGRGMRACADPESLRRAFEEASREAESAFGDAGLYLEKRIEGGRHVEFQVLCDAFGNGIHLGERECSVQRNHQKLIEESPSPALDDDERRAFGARVAKAAVALGYRNAGTVEFLRDRDGRLYFMEMNTRLQVEHPVTEMVTGVDLVEAQLRIAANRPLWLGQDQIESRGHAVELRINAEDPDRGFRPDPGELTAFEPPPAELAGCRVRWDSAVRSGYRIPPHYDSMIGKLIVHGPDRATAIAGAVEALRVLRVEGVATTRDLHLRILQHDTFRSGEYDVDFVRNSGVVG